MDSLVVDPQMQQLLACYLHNAASANSIIVPQFEHRLQLLREWSPQEASHILEVGCGQGECTLVLAQAVGSSGSVTAIDPGAPDYGGPFTIGQAQEYIKKSELGPRIEFMRADAPTLLQDPSLTRRFDAAVLCHCLWYFTSPEAIQHLFGTLKKAKIPRVFIAEHSLQSSNLAQIPHVLAAQAQKRLQQLLKGRAFNGKYGPNVRLASSPDELRKLATEAGWSVKKQGYFTPGQGLRDGHWEVAYVLSEQFPKDVARQNLEVLEEQEVMAYVERVKEAVDEMKAGGFEEVRMMDTWWAVLEIE